MKFIFCSLIVHFSSVSVFVLQCNVGWVAYFTLWTSCLWYLGLRSLWDSIFLTLWRLNLLNWHVMYSSGKERFFEYLTAPTMLQHCFISSISVMHAAYAFIIYMSFHQCEAQTLLYFPIFFLLFVTLWRASSSRIFLVSWSFYSSAFWCFDK